MAKGVGVVDVGGGGIIHCTAGVIALGLCLLVSPNETKAGNVGQVSGPTSSSHCWEDVQACFFLAGFTLVHGVSVSNVPSARHAVSLPDMVIFSPSE